MFGPFPFSAFRFFWACGWFLELPPLFVSVRPGFPGSNFVYASSFWFLSSNGFTDFEEFGPCGDGLLSATVRPRDMSHVRHGHVHRDDGTQLTLGTHGCIFGAANFGRA